MKRKISGLLAVAAIAGLTALPVRAQTPNPVSVAIELALLVDVSGSISTAEYNLQRQGYVNAFNDATIQNMIANTPGGVAVAYIEWSSGTQQSLQVPWTVLTTQAEVAAFATALSNVTRAFSGNTGPGSAIAFGAASIANNNISSSFQMMDVSGDGTENSGIDTSDARDAALAAGIDRINGLAIGGTSLQTWYANNVQGGAGSFTEAAATFSDFQDAIYRKLYREISTVPEGGPGMALFGLVMAGLVALRRKLS